MFSGMANPQKQKGDRAEREAVAELVSHVPDLVVLDAQRKLGAGRKADTGDLAVFVDVAIQVKSMARLGTALREAAAGAATQAARARVSFALGMAPVPRARKGTVRWLAACLEWPDVHLAGDEVARFASLDKLIEHLRNDGIGIPRERRVAMLVRAGADPVVVAPIEAWLAAYRRERTASGLAAPLGPTDFHVGLQSSSPGVSLAG